MACERREGSRLIVHTRSVDPALAGVGGGPSIGDLNATGIVLPAAPTTSQTRRYLASLCTIIVPEGKEAEIVSVKQLLTIGVDVKVEEDLAPYWHFELPVTDPVWRFVDGNVSWHLMSTQAESSASSRIQFTDVFPPAPPYIQSRGTMQSGILSRATILDGGYIPLNGGQPYGEPVAGLGYFSDMRWPWSAQDPSESLGIRVRGPRRIVLFASVHQTDPELRPNKPVLVEDSWLKPEDRFVLQNPEARYWRIGARMAVDMYDVAPRPAGRGVKKKDSCP